MTWTRASSQAMNSPLCQTSCTIVGVFTSFFLASSLNILLGSLLTPARTPARELVSEDFVSGAAAEDGLKIQSVFRTKMLPLDDLLRPRLYLERSPVCKEEGRALAAARARKVPSCAQDFERT